jgi:hypothetical protein
MDKKYAYEEELKNRLEQLPLPDVELAWKDMERRLDEKENHRPVLFPFQFGCLLWCLMGGMALYFITWSLSFTEERSQGKSKKTSTHSQLNDSTGIPEQTDGLSKKNLSVMPENSFPKTDSTASGGMNFLISKEVRTVLAYNESDKKGYEEIITPLIMQKKLNEKINTNRTIAIKPVKKNRPANENIVIHFEQETESLNPLNNKLNDFIIVSAAPVIPAKEDGKVADSASTKQKNDIVTGAAVPLAALKKDTAILKQKPKNPSKQDVISFSVGIALWQRLDGNSNSVSKVIPAGRDSAGGSNSAGKLYDYIPSAFARMYKGEKWFLQAELRYRAPAYINNITFSQKSITSGATTRSTEKILSKTQHHQAALTINYTPLKNLSVGGGFIWNRFSQAIVSEQTVLRIANLPRDSILSFKQTVYKGADTNFVKSFFQLRAEVEYKWRRFSAGVNYTRGLQPYLRFILPNGVRTEEKINSLQLFLRYKIWRSRKK